MFILQRPHVPRGEDLVRMCAHVDPVNWEYIKGSTVKRAMEEIAEYDKAMQIAETTPEKETFDLERLYALYGFEGAAPEFVLTQDRGLSHFVDYYIHHPEIKTLGDYARHLQDLDQNGSAS